MSLGLKYYNTRFSLPVLIALIVLGCSAPENLSPYLELGDLDVPTGQMLVTGKISLSSAAKSPFEAKSAAESYALVAQSNQTGQMYRGLTDGNGVFKIYIPGSEAGNTFLIAILGPDGRAVGPMVFAVFEDKGLTGLVLEGTTFLGTITLPDNTRYEPIAPGNDADFDDERIDPYVYARLNSRGVPVGLCSSGKCQRAELPDDYQDDGNEKQLADGDRDGLIDIFDADDDGDGIVDDFEGQGDPGGIPSDLIVNFFMNLKISAEQAGTYYAGSVEQIDAALAVDTIITFEVMPAPGAGRTVTAARMLDIPAPVYVASSSRMTDGPDGLTFAPWSDVNYAFEKSSDRLGVFVRPNDVMDSGDTFTVEVTYGDGTTEQFSRMVNYVFKNIPKLVQYGTADATTSFNITSGTVNGTAEKPIPFDGTKDLVLVFNPPPDENDYPLTQLDYTFTIFYEADGRQLNDQIDFHATWPSPPANFERGTFRVPNSALGELTDGKYMVTLPKELFPETVITITAQGVQPVDQYKIDITAECSSGNAAIMLTFQRSDP